MIPAAFEYERAESVEHALDLLGRFGEDAKLLAGGQSLLPLMKFRFARPSALVDIGRLSELRYVRAGEGGVAVGALTPYSDLEHDETLRRECPLLAAAAAEVGDPQVRHVGTIGGAVAHADPASDVPAALVALGGQIVVRGTGGERAVPAEEFFRGVFETALAPGEMVTEVRVPATRGGWSYAKFHPRAQDWAIVGVAVASANGGASVVLTNMGPTPVRARSVEAALAAGEGPERAAQAAADGTDPVDDTFASAEYRRYLAPVLVRRALEEAMARR